MQFPKMLQDALLLLSVTATLVFAQTEHNSNNLIVHARTGTFVGDLNDTYPDVRQFKYVPYAKVRSTVCFSLPYLDTHVQNSLP